MHDLLPSITALSTHERLQHNFHPSTGVVTKGFSKRPGGVKSIQIRAVCRNCNNGWMSLLEKEVSSILTPLIKGESVTHSKKNIGVLCRWIAMKCMVAENDKPNSNLTPQNDRRALKNQNIIPEYYKIYVGNHVTESKIWYIRHSHTIAFSPDGPNPQLDGVSKNVQTLTFIMGAVLIHINAARVCDFEIEEKINIIPFWESTRVFPKCDSEMTWPRRPFVGKDGVSLITNCLQTYFDDCKTHWSDKPL